MVRPAGGLRDPSIMRLEIIQGKGPEFSRNFLDVTTSPPYPAKEQPDPFANAICYRALLLGRDPAQLIVYIFRELYLGSYHAYIIMLT